MARKSPAGARLSQTSNLPPGGSRKSREGQIELGSTVSHRRLLDAACGVAMGSCARGALAWAVSVNPLHR